MSKIKTKDIKEKGLEELADELDKAQSLDILAQSEGGKILVKSLATDVISSLDTLTIKYKELTLEQFISLSADMKTKLDVIRALKRAKSNKEFLHETLEEQLQQ